MAAPRAKRIVGTSLKMYFDIPSTIAYAERVRDTVAPAATAADIDLFLIPDFLSLPPVAKTLRASNIILGAQNCASELAGAYTGEVSARSLQQLEGVKIVEIGHAERRRLYGEQDQDVAKKAALIVQHGMVPLICVGEVSRSNIASQAVGLAVSEIKPQVEAALSGIPDDADVIIAYEPVWAIGAAQPATADHVIAVTQNIRSLVTRRGGRTRILYGGSAGPGLFEQLKEGVDGLFLGRFAHDVQNLAQVVSEMSRP